MIPIFIKIIVAVILDLIDDIPVVCFIALQSIVNYSTVRWFNLKLNISSNNDTL